MPKNKSKNKDSLHLENFSEKNWDEDLNIGLKGSFLTTKILGAYMAKNKNGLISEYFLRFRNNCTKPRHL